MRERGVREGGVSRVCEGRERGERGVGEGVRRV